MGRGQGGKAAARAHIHRNLADPYGDQAQKGGGLGFWLLPLLALIPLGFIVLRRKK